MTIKYPVNPKWKNHNGTTLFHGCESACGHCYLWGDDEVNKKITVAKLKYPIAYKTEDEIDEIEWEETNPDYLNRLYELRDGPTNNLWFEIEGLCHLTARHSWGRKLWPFHSHACKYFHHHANAPIIKDETGKVIDPTSINTTERTPEERT